MKPFLSFFLLLSLLASGAWARPFHQIEEEYLLIRNIDSASYQRDRWVGIEGEFLSYVGKYPSGKHAARALHRAALLRKELFRAGGPRSDLNESVSFLTLLLKATRAQSKNYKNCVLVILKVGLFGM